MSARRKARIALGRALRAVLHPLVGPCLRLAARHPSVWTMRLLRATWGNRLGAAAADYLTAVARSVRTVRPRHVLECGSGLTTLLLGALAPPSGYRVLSLEDDEVWMARVRQEVTRLGLESVQVVHTPLTPEADGYSWYSTDAVRDRLPARFDLVVCDGPLGTTTGGRFGLLPVLHERLDGAFILLDDASRPGEQDVLDRWKAEFDAEVTFRPTYERGLAVVRVPAAATPSSDR
jgi:Methyltransferase domain